MYKKNLYSLVTLILIALVWSCSGKEAGQNLDATQPESVEPVYQISFKESMIFGSTDEHIIALRGWGSAISDERNRVYIPDLTNVIHVFDETGRHIAQMGRKGRGPGEFLYMSALQITPDNLYIYDTLSHRITTYSLTDFTPSNTILLSSENWKDIEALKNVFPRNEFYVTDEGRMLLAFYTRSRGAINYDTVEQDDLNKNKFIDFYWLNPNGEVISDKVFEQEKMKSFLIENWGSRAIANFEILGKPIQTVSSNGVIAAAQSTEFKITIYSLEGRVTNVINFPFTKAPLTREELVEEYKNGFPGKEKALNNMDLPTTRPALEKMFFDDQNRIWVAAIVSDLSVYEWFIFNLEGDLLSQFTWDRDKLIQDVNGGFMYAMQENEIEERIIVRYKIEFTER